MGFGPDLPSETAGSPGLCGRTVVFVSRAQLPFLPLARHCPVGLVFFHILLLRHT